MNFKHTVSRLTAGLLLASTLITPAFAATGTVNTEGSSLRLRAEASTSSSVLKQLSHGTQVDVLSGLVDGWYQVSYKGTTGYVSGEYLTVTEDSAAVPAPQATAAPAAESVPDKVYIKVTEGPLNIRSGPSTDYDRVGSLSTGRTAEVVEKLDGWYHISNGYVSADYVTEIDAAAYEASYSKGQEIADYALQFKGYRYVHGGSSPSGFDCSGFPSYVLRPAGQRHPRLHERAPARRHRHLQEGQRQHPRHPCGALHRKQPVHPRLHRQGGRHHQQAERRLLHHWLRWRPPDRLISYIKTRAHRLVPDGGRFFHKKRNRP